MNELFVPNKLLILYGRIFRFLIIVYGVPHPGVLLIHQNVIRRTTISAAVEGRYPTAPQVDAEMSHQLYVLQTLLFNLLEERKNTKADSTDQVQYNV